MPRRSSASGGSSRRSSGGSFGSSGGQKRPASTVPAHPPPAAQPPVQHAPAQRSGGSGLFGQMASTAAGVAVGHTIGNGISNALFGGRGGHDEVEAAAPAQQEQAGQSQLNKACMAQLDDYYKCMNSNQGGCDYYLEAFRACQANVSSGSNWA